MNNMVAMWNMNEPERKSWKMIKSQHTSAEETSRNDMNVNFIFDM